MQGQKDAGCRSQEQMLFAFGITNMPRGVSSDRGLLKTPNNFVSTVKILSKILSVFGKSQA